MNKINRKIEYALMALKYMVQKKPGELTTAKEVSETLRSPFDATAKVMQVMVSQGLLRSEQGAFGGYQISKDLSNVTMRDLIGIIEGFPTIAKCLHKEKSEGCEIQATCNIAYPVYVLNQKLNEFYQNISLKELLRDSIKESFYEAKKENSPTEAVLNG